MSNKPFRTNHVEQTISNKLRTNDSILLILKTFEYLDKLKVNLQSSAVALSHELEIHCLCAFQIETEGQARPPKKTETKYVFQ
jgi:hypothetical protein